MQAEVVIQIGNNEPMTQTWEDVPVCTQEELVKFCEARLDGTGTELISAHHILKELEDEEDEEDEDEEWDDDDETDWLEENDDD
jgi:hypothetical protein